MTDLLISLIKIEDRYFPAYQAVDRDPTVRSARQRKTRRDALRSDWSPQSADGRRDGACL